MFAARGVVCIGFKRTVVHQVQVVKRVAVPYEMIAVFHRPGTVEARQHELLSIGIKARQ